MPGDVELLLRVGVGAALAAALGTEREHRGQVAGCGRTAWWPAARRIFMLAGAYRCAAVHRGSNVDPMRVAAQAAAGVGFIGGGAILKEARRSAVRSHARRARPRAARGSGVLPSLAVRAAPGQQQCAGVGGVADELGTFRLNFVSTGIDWREVRVADRREHDVIAVAPATSASAGISRRDRPVAAGLRSLSPAVAVVGTRPDGALACRRGCRTNPALSGALKTIRGVDSTGCRNAGR